VHIPWDSPPPYSPDGKLLASWSDDDTHIRVWVTRTRQLVSTLPASEVDKIAFSPAQIEHPLGDRLMLPRKNAIRLFGAYTGHLYTHILGQARAYTALIRWNSAGILFLQFWYEHLR